MKRSIEILLIVASVWLWAINCSASYITLNIENTSRFRRDGITALVRVTNNGDEPAMNVWIEALLADKSATSEICPSLEVLKKHEFPIDLGPPPERPGIYNVIIKVHYSDANGIPFMALSSIPLVTTIPDPEKEPLSGQMAEIRIGRKATLEVDLKTAATNSTRVSATLLLPREILCEQTSQELELPSGGKAKLEFTVANKAALPGSSYYVFAVLDYDNGCQHRSIIVPGKMHVTTPSAAIVLNLRLTKRHAMVIMIISAVLLAFAQIPGIPHIPKSAIPYFEFLIFAAVLYFILCHFPINLIFKDTLTTGGDIPAHSYLASHLHDSLFKQFRIISWADGWWAGFPMYQYYFCLPYLLVALLALIIPFNIAFKLVSVLGIVMLPVCAWLAGRIMKLPRPACHLLAIATIPLLFDRGHVMWGVNIYSTLAGMISNSISFPIMLLFVACAARDANDGKTRSGTIVLLVLLIASHFFTSIIAAMSVAFIPFLRPHSGFKKAVTVLVKEGLLALVLMSWWIVPLMAKREYSVDFGVNWDVKFSEILPGVVGICAMGIGILTAIVMSLVERKYRFIPITICILLASAFLFRFGYQAVSPVFVNVRLYPFMAYSILALAAAGTGIALDKLKCSELGVIAIMTAIMIYGIGQPNHVNAWANWNYSGLEGKSNYDVIKELVIPLKGTPGRLANDLHDNNNSLGSTRVFECVPHLTGKPILEGGIVNSALGSLFAYYIQGETSKNCAGFPTIVKPTSFNMKNGTRHLELFNVKHFIARWENTKRALAESGDWQFLRRCKDWELYELTSHNGEYVFIPKYLPAAVVTDRWKEAGLEWIYQITAIDQPFAILSASPEEDNIQMHITEEQFKELLTCLKNTNAFPSWFTPRYSTNLLPENSAEILISEEKTGNGLKFRTNAIGLPHIIKCTWFPNWKVRGAKKIYKVTPCFMLVYPEQNEVELYYGSTVADNIGRLITIAGIGFIATATVKSRLSRTGKENLKQKEMHNES